ncbi:MAG TPA: glycine zipper 2TM domain-containing protein, partial [Rhodospirillales bacterium]|nr:glycine zipper 2TM domain-containing protein [Rhodospirillales bacterium]
MIEKSVTPLFIMVFFLAACAARDQDTNEKIGTTTGAVIGAVLGSRIGGSMDDRTGRILGASLGALFGSIIGKEVARTLSEAELRQADEAAQEA